MRKLLFLMHSSLDGFAATEDGGMDWISLPEELFEDVGKLTDDADAAIYGRKTYELMEGYWPTAGDRPNASKHDKDHAAWYKKVDKYVVSRGKPKTGDKAEVIGKDLEAEIKKIKSLPGKNILLLGSPSTAQSCLELGLIDELWINVNPIVLGKGVAFYPQENKRVALELVRSKAYKPGVITLVYVPKK